MQLPLNFSRKGAYENDEVKLAQEGNKEAFINLIDKNRTYLFRIARQIVTDFDYVDDAIQETILKAWKQVKSLRNSEYFRTWLTRILINECNAILRKKERVISLESVINENTSYEDNYKNVDLMNALNSLEHELKILILLHYFEDMQYKDISYILNIPEGTIKSRISRAKKQLQEILNCEEGGRV